MIDVDVTVDTVEFRQAIAAVVPHAGVDPEWPRLMRIRVYVGSEMVTLAATDRYSAALALVSIRDRGSWTLGCFDVLPADLVEISRLFKPTSEEAKSGACALRLEASEKDLTCTDVGGMFPGTSLTLNALTVDDEFPSIAQVMRVAQIRGAEWVPPAGFQFLLGVSGQVVARFVAATKAYSEPLRMRPTGRSASMLVTCGDMFYAALMPLRSDDDADRAHDAVVAGWDDHLSDVMASHPAARSSWVADVERLEVMLAGPDGVEPPERKRGRRTAGTGGVADDAEGGDPGDVEDADEPAADAAADVAGQAADVDEFTVDAVDGELVVSWHRGVSDEERAAAAADTPAAGAVWLEFTCACGEVLTAGSHSELDDVTIRHLRLCKRNGFAAPEVESHPLFSGGDDAAGGAS